MRIDGRVLLYFDFQPPVFFIIISYQVTACQTIYLSTLFLDSRTTPQSRNSWSTSRTKSSSKYSKEPLYSLKL